MLDDYLEVEESELPKLNDARMDELAKEMGDEWENYRKMRRSLEDEIWPACDKAFHAIKEPYPLSTMRYVDNSQIGDSTLRESIKNKRNQLITAVMPPDASWLEMASLDDEDTEDQLARAKEYNIHLHRQAGTHNTMEPVLDQLFGRGATAIGWTWQKRVRVKKVPKQLEETIEALSMDLSGKNLTKKDLALIKTYHTYFDGPKTYPIDLYRLWWDPTVDLTIEPDIPMVFLFLKTVEDLKRAVDEETKEPLYDHDVLDQCKLWSYADFYKEFSSALTSTKIMGIDPSLDTESRFIPIFLFHRFHRETEDGEVYVDKFFYLARGSEDSAWKIIRVQDNPSHNGHRPFFFTVCDRWMNLPYGTGLVEKALAPFAATNLMKNLALNANVMSVFPPTSHYGNVSKDGSRPKWMPGASTEITYRPNIGLDWIKAFPINPNNIVLSMQEIRALKEEMVSQTGGSASTMASNQTRRLSKNRTATEIRQEAIEGSTTDQSMADKIGSDLVQPVAQAIYDHSRQKNVDGVKFSSRSVTGQPKTVKMTGEELDRERAIEVVGRRGIANKAEEINNLMEVVKIITTGNAAEVMQNLPLILHDVLFQLIGRLGVAMKPEYKMTAMEITQGNPKAQMEMLQAALQTEEGRQIALQFLMEQPEVQQMLRDVIEQAQGEGAAAAQQQQQATTAEG